MLKDNYIKLIAIDRGTPSDTPPRRTQVFYYFFRSEDEKSFLTAYNAAIYKSEKLKEEKYKAQPSIWRHVDDCPYPEVGEVRE